ncbi:MAG: hypothetical protein J6B43_02975 [Lachnospiraceae bacterium]|nr:hypothetical protein [Lachnospiraceae bacterium]
MDKNTFDGLSDIDIPSIAKGTILPDSVYLKEIEEAKAKDAIRKQHKHDYFVAAFNATIAAVISLIVSILYNCLH